MAFEFFHLHYVIFFFFAKSVWRFSRFLLRQVLRVHVSRYTQIPKCHRHTTRGYRATQSSSVFIRQDYCHYRLCPQGFEHPLRASSQTGARPQTMTLQSSLAHIGIVVLVHLNCSLDILYYNQSGGGVVDWYSWVCCLQRCVICVKEDTSVGSKSFAKW